jgi:hypothetical protein
MVLKFIVGEESLVNVHYQDFAATYLVGYLNPNIVAVEVNGVQVSVKTGIDLVVLAGYYHYAKQVIEKLTEIIKGDLFVSEVPLFKGDGRGKTGDPDAQSGGLSGSNASDETVCEDTTSESQDTEQDMPTESGSDNTECNIEILVHLFVHETEEENDAQQTDPDKE